MTGEWNPDMDAAPRDGTPVDLWVWRADRDIHDCYFPKMVWEQEGCWISYEHDTQVGYPHLWRHITPPATP